MNNITPAQITHYKQLVGQLYDFHKRELFQDCIIHLKDGDKVKVHRLVLATMSHLLKCIFQYDYGDENNPIPATSDRNVNCPSNQTLRDPYSNAPVDEPNVTNAANRMGGDGFVNPIVHRPVNYVNHGEGDITDNINTSASTDSTDNENNTNHVILVKPHVCHSVEIHLNVSLEIMTLIIDYAYTGTCDITWQNVQELFSSANEYEILGLLELCIQFLETNLTLKNCIGIFVNAKQYFCKELFDNTKVFILKNFEIIARNKINSELLDIPFDELYEILTDDYLNCKKEETVFRVIRNWIDHDTSKRLPYLDRLLTATRFGYLTREYCQNAILKWSVMRMASVSERFL